MNKAEPIEGPTDTNDLHVSAYRLAHRMGLVEDRGVHSCAHEDCGQPALVGRLYCSDRCMTRGRRSPAKMTIDGVTATLREHADRVGINLGTVYCRLRAGLTPEEAITKKPDEEMQRRRRGDISTKND